MEGRRADFISHCLSYWNHICIVNIHQLYPHLSFVAHGGICFRDLRKMKYLTSRTYDLKVKLQVYVPAID